MGNCLGTSAGQSVLLKKTPAQLSALLMCYISPLNKASTISACLPWFFVKLHESTCTYSLRNARGPFSLTEHFYLLNEKR